MNRDLKLTWLRWKRHLRSLHGDATLPAQRKAARLLATTIAEHSLRGRLCRRSLVLA